MEYRKGTIARKTGTRFKDNGQIDPRRNGHPVLIPITSDDNSQDTYYLMVNSHPEKYIRFGDAYYIIEDWQGARLREPSVINLKFIYKDNVDEDIYGGLSPKILKDVIRQFKEYQEMHPDEFYDEIKGKL